MPFVTVPKDTWTTVATASGNTMVQNRGPAKMVLTTEATGSLARDEGISIGPEEGVVFSDGKAIKAYSPFVDSRVYYGAI